MSHSIYQFKATGQSFNSQKELEEAQSQFYGGELTEEFISYCAKKNLHAFWLNYQTRVDKIDKRKFCDKFTGLINQMLREL